MAATGRLDIWLYSHTGILVVRLVSLEREREREVRLKQIELIRKCKLRLFVARWLAVYYLGLTLSLLHSV